jgi:hypothetical protein
MDFNPMWVSETNQKRADGAKSTRNKSGNERTRVNEEREKQGQGKEVTYPFMVPVVGDVPKFNVTITPARPALVALQP